MLHDVVQRKKFYTLVLQKCLTRSDYEEKLSVINAIHKPIYRNYSNDYLEIWLQRLVVKNLKEKNQFIDEYISNSKNFKEFFLYSAV